VTTSTRRSQCANHPVQLGIALQNYEAAYEVLPPGCVNDKGPIRNTGARPNAAGPGRGPGDWQDEGQPGDAAGPEDPARRVGGFGSFHPGGGNYLFGDGHVMYVSDGINIPVYRQLGHRADGKLLEQRDF